MEIKVQLTKLSKIDATFGRARRLAGKEWLSFPQILDEPNAPVHYDEQDFQKGLETLSHLLVIIVISAASTAKVQLEALFC